MTHPRSRSRSLSLLVLAALGAAASAQVAPVVGPPKRLAPAKRGDSYSWRYYRVGNTGLQGDVSDALWVGPDGDPYVGGYDPPFEEGGFARFVQAEDRWENVSNVDHPVIGHPEEQGCVRIRDIVPDATGRLWMGTWVGALSYDPAVGPSSLVRYGPANSKLAKDHTFDVDRAPDGTMWFANGGTVRYDPATDAWTRWNGLGNLFLSVQPKPSGGYLVWSSSRSPIRDTTFVFDSDTQQWDVQDVSWPFSTPGAVVGMPGKDCVDDAGNFWALRLTTLGDFDSLDYRKPDGTWVAPPEPYYGVTFDLYAFAAYGDGRAVLADAGGQVFRFDGVQWSSLGVWQPGAFTEALDVDAAGNVWACGPGGAARYDVATAAWQRYRITNTGNFDDFNLDLTVDPATGVVHAGANATAGVGGMVRFDGERWTPWNQLHYGLGHDWPFPNDNCDALAVRASGDVVVAPGWSYGVHEWNGASFDALAPLDNVKRLCEDSLGRVWAIQEYYGLQVFAGGAWTSVGIDGWGQKVAPDPNRPGTVWAFTQYEVRRTDGLGSTFSRQIPDFPELAVISDRFLGVAAGEDDVAWVGATAQLGYPNEGGALFKIDTTTGAYDVWRSEDGWPFPGDTVAPLTVTPDGRVWMLYSDLAYPHPGGLLWYDGQDVHAFPAPIGGKPQWGGLPHQNVTDLEVRPIQGGYELWMTCSSRGIAVLTVR